jgi:hypothetical protein
MNNIYSPNELEWDGTPEQRRYWFNRIRKTRELVNGVLADGVMRPASKVEMLAADILAIKIDGSEKDAEKRFAWNCYRRLIDDPDLANNPAKLMCGDVGEVDAVQDGKQRHSKTALSKLHISKPQPEENEPKVETETKPTKPIGDNDYTTATPDPPIATSPTSKPTLMIRAVMGDTTYHGAGFEPCEGAASNDSDGGCDAETNTLGKGSRVANLELDEQIETAKSTKTMGELDAVETKLMEIVGRFEQKSEIEPCKLEILANSRNSENGKGDLCRNTKASCKFQIDFKRCLMCQEYGIPCEMNGQRIRRAEIYQHFGLEEKEGHELRIKASRLRKLIMINRMRVSNPQLAKSS